ncbi:MAG: HDIG domain-containing protein [Ignavibacteriales bacterium]|nr:HDIG domain-containing protein [Ignavibacteriales bacterium]
MTNENLKTRLRESRRVKILIVFVTIILIVAMFPRGESIESEVTVGSVWIKDDLIASTTFEILKNAETYEREIAKAANNVLPVFLKDKSIIEVTIDSVKKYNSLIFRLTGINRQPAGIFNQTFLSNRSFQIFYNLKNESSLYKDLETRSISEIFRLAGVLIENIYEKGLLDLTFNEITSDSISIRNGKYERAYSKTLFYDRITVINFINNFIAKNIGREPEVNEAFTEYVNFFLKPNIIFSGELTELAKKSAKEKIPRNIGIVNENERIVAKHDRISPEIKLKIDSYRIAKGEDTGFWTRFSQSFGKAVHILIILILIIIYIYLFRKRIYNDNVKILLISIIILFISALTFLIYKVNVSAPIEFLVVVPVASMLLTIVFDSRIGFYGTVVISLIVGGLRGNDYVFTVMNIVAGGFSAYTVRDIKNRTQIFRSFFYILLGYVISIIAFGLERFDSFEQMAASFAFAASNALMSPVFTYGLIIFIERIFKITTDLTLLELTDFNHPLLKDLARNAPGTFNHTMMMATLAETASETVGANPILARVGAYFHDIGKSLDPDTFVENQLNAENKHEKLPPERSAQLIQNHVKRGIELAESYELPREVINFIPMHHGTMVISFFYEKAKSTYGEDKVNIEDYRYIGPKPNTRETAIVMLADACESTVRSLTDADAEKIENVINNIVSARLEDGQLDEAPLTFRDIKKIKESFHNILIGQHHRRIKYPNQNELEISKEQKQ